MHRVLIIFSVTTLAKFPQFTNNIIIASPACVWIYTQQYIYLLHTCVNQYIDNITWCFQYPPWYLAEVPSICPRPKAEGKYGTEAKYQGGY